MRLHHLAAAAVFSLAAASAQQSLSSAQLELLRSDVKAKKQQIITQVLGLNDGQAAVFWPIYRQYETELAKIYDQKLQLLKDLERDWDTLDLTKSNKYARLALNLEIERAKLKEKYYKRFYSNMTSMVGAKWLQIESMLLTAMDVQMQTALPLLK